MSAMGAALRKLLRPVVRLLLKHSFSYGAFEAIAKRVFVETAMEDFALPGKKPSVSRAAILTGLTRKDVNFLLTEPWSSPEAGRMHYNRAARVLTAWVREAAYQDTDGMPRDLPIEGAAGFADLVRQHSGDIPTMALLDELVRVGAVQPQVDGRIRLTQRAFVPSESVAQMLEILGVDVRELMETILHNIEHGSSSPRFQRKVMHTDIPNAVLPEFRTFSAKRSQALLEQFDAWLSSRDFSAVPEEDWSARGGVSKVSVGIYYYEEVVAHAGGTK